MQLWLHLPGAAMILMPSPTPAIIHWHPRSQVSAHPAANRQEAVREDTRTISEDNATPHKGCQMLGLSQALGEAEEEKLPQLKVNTETKQSRASNASAAPPMQTALALWQPSPDKGVSGFISSCPASPCSAAPLGTVIPTSAHAHACTHMCNAA